MKPIQRKRRRIAYFAPWAKMRPFTKEKHTLTDGKITYTVAPGTAYANHVETAGFGCAAIISYGCTADGTLRLMRHVTYPTLRLYPNETGSALDHNFKGYALQADGHRVKEQAKRFVFDGILHLYSSAPGLEICRSLCAAREGKALIERLEITNRGTDPVKIQLKSRDTDRSTRACYGVDRRRYRLLARCNPPEGLTLAPGEIGVLCCAYCGAEVGERFAIDYQGEIGARRAFMEELRTQAVIETPEAQLNAMAFYTKLRACESIFRTKAGLMHSPGGGYYYAALWTNDQCEYVNPYFGVLAYPPAREQAENCYRMYQKYIAPDKALITSIIAQGDGIWHGAKDRGDSAMYAYGCARYLLTAGDKALAARYIDGIRDCITYTLSQIGPEGVVRSDSDELENRFESGSYNLCTSSLAYDALRSTACLERELGSADRARQLEEKAADLKAAVERYFGANVEGYNTYRYCAEEKRLRAWIAIPLAMGITDRSSQTVDALLSDKLFQNGGIVTRSGEKTYWDRATLYALRGMFCAGERDRALSLLRTYTASRLLGEHIPYPVEAYPEGNQAQLSAESGLYQRIFIEGILGYRPTGFARFDLTPNLPAEWNDFAIRRLTLCGQQTDIALHRTAAGIEITVALPHRTITQTAANGQTVTVQLNEEEI